MSKTKTASGQKFGKTAFLNAAKNTNERLLLQVILQDGTTYTKEEVAKLVEDWKKKEVKA
ncbi:hypothetical protein [Heyndrickxia oleronia]|uniref:hypothetical protein n=1 Tax=Heyndrickxia oleronia TaxID=38875 RepID=UPI001B1F1927|nr:hypothetical protein [Heyndrickxia oleronia]GIN37796.1 hypothetical protein J19TS1_07450 [Heyndrickxia oleronia]